MYRDFDATGISGVGKVLEGVEFSDGSVAVRWCAQGKPVSTAVYDSMEVFRQIHVYPHPENGTSVRWGILAEMRDEGSRSRQ
ncbi:MAG: hypothetical protein Q8R28_15275 [Dehalococcoidia bacterium]|nr:hypothetical protein [Dehalococcoidia bacterium]